jgi:type IV pilus assembly protein PilV
MLMRTPQRPRSQGGFTLIEILVTIVLLLIGLLGMMGLQSSAARVEFESYQRGEALSLAREMQARIQNSRTIVAGLLDDTVSSTDGSVYVGSGATNYMTSGACVPGGGVALADAKYEMCKWGESLLGGSAQDTTGGTTTNVGAMLNARGCLIKLIPAQGNALADFYIVVVWQGVAPGKEPLGTLSGETASPGSQCASAQAYPTGLRRAVAVRVMVPRL